MKDLIDAEMAEYSDGAYADHGSARDSLERFASRVKADALEAQAKEIEALKQQAQALRNGNTLLISALMDMVGQFFYSKDDTADGPLTHAFMSAEEQAIEVLMQAGFATEKEGAYYLDWDKLNKRMEEMK